MILNDLSKQAADAVVAEINKLGKGKAVANYDSAVAGDKIIGQAISTFGAVHVGRAELVGSACGLITADMHLSARRF